VIAFRHQNKLSVAHCERFVNAAVSGVHLLDGKALWPFDGGSSNLFEVHFRGRVMDIVFVGRKAGPIALGVKTSTTSKRCAGNSGGIMA